MWEKPGNSSIWVLSYEDKEEAYWVRWYAEHVIFKEFAYPKKEPFILGRRKKELKLLVEKNVQRLDN